MQQAEQVIAALREHPLVLLEAPPGTGKTTGVPPACLKAFNGQVWVLEPRRLAARYAARWVASQMGQAVGEEVGFWVRLERASGPRTRLIYLTQGVFSRCLASGLPDDLEVVILDEFHERNLDNDLALAWLRSQSRVKVVIMSASLPEGLAAALGHPPRIITQSRLFPVSIAYDRRDLSEVVPEQSGSGLVFLPGMGEIRKAQQALEKSARRCGAQLQILHGSLDTAEQDQVLQADPNSRRWVLTTNVAETSLTVPGIDWVVDSGWVRRLQQRPGVPLARLETGRISQFSALQRSGRAGRQKAGHCIRLYTETELRSRPLAEEPEILHSDLSSLVLLWHQLGRPKLQWLDSPPGYPPPGRGTEGGGPPLAWQAAESLLHQLGALQEDQLTPLGRAMAGLPVEPRLARFLLSYPRPQGRRVAAWLSRGGERNQSDLEVFIGSGQRFPEERQLHCSEEFACGQLDDALLAAFPDRVAQVRRGKDLVFADGQGFQLKEPLVDNPWLLVLAAELDGRNLQLLAYQRIEPELLLERLELAESVQMVWNESGARVEAATRLGYGTLVLEESRRRAQPGPQAAALLLEKAQATGWWREQLSRLESWQQRWHWASRLGPLPPLGEPLEWLQEVCQMATSLAELQSLTWDPGPIRHRLRELCPTRISLGKRQVEVHYEPDQPPWIESKLVDFFGLAQGPQLAGGRIPLVLRLLAPNHRPLQITQDLAGFWERHYPKIRQELCRRYPRHPWPVDPLQPQAEELRPKRRQ
jgi:ATP-dependent helicase HrpB